MKLPEILIYDFDGVICDSVSIKTEAFTELYKPYGKEIQNKVKAYHLTNGGISRYEKFRYYETKLIGNKITESKINELADLFSFLVKEKVIASNFIPGALDFIKKNQNRRQFICTGTPQLEIDEIVNEKKIKSFFENVYGSPMSKEIILRKILEITESNPQNCIFFGDAMTDYNASTKCGIPFIGIKNNKTQFPEKTTLINDFNDLINFNGTN